MHAALLIKNDFEQGCSMGVCVCAVCFIRCAGARLMTKPVSCSVCACVCELLCWERLLPGRFPCAHWLQFPFYISAVQHLGPWAPLCSAGLARGGIGRRTAGGVSHRSSADMGNSPKSTFRMIIWISNCYPSSMRSLLTAAAVIHNGSKLRLLLFESNF